MSYSKIAHSIGESGTLKMNQIANTLRAQGEAVIHLGGGEPKTLTPIAAITASTELIETGQVRYTAASGTPALKEAIIKYTQNFYDQQVEPKNVIVSSGAKQSIMVAFQAILDPGDEVIFPKPYWVSYPDMVKLCGAIPKPATPRGQTFYPTIADIERQVTPKTKAILINSPSNPTGALFSRGFINDMVAFCEKKDLWLIMDDIYHRLIFDAKKPISVYDFTKKPLEESKVIVINGVSKQYAMTGFRIGWTIGNPTLVKLMATIQGHQTSCPSAISQAGAVGAINGDQSSVGSLRLTLENNRNVMMDQIADFDGVEAFRPDGTFYCFADFRKFCADSNKLAHFLLDKVRVVTVPGIEFGVDGWLRLSTCGSVDEIVEGMTRIKWALNPEATEPIRIGKKTVTKDWSTIP